MPELNIDQEGAGDDDAVGKVVEGVTHQDRHAATTRLVGVVAVLVVMVIPLVMMRVVDQRELLQQEEAEDARQQGPTERVGIGPAVEGFRQQVRDRSRQQQAGGHGHEPVHHLRQVAKAQHRGQPDRQQRGNQIGEDDVAERTHAVRNAGEPADGPMQRGATERAP